MKLREVNNKTKEALIKSIDKILDVDITDKSRKAEVITGRMIYYALLRDMNYSWTSIARSVNKNHATVINGYRVFEDLVSYEQDLQESFEMVKSDYYDRNNEHPFQFVSRMRLVGDAIDLEKQNKKLTLDINELMLERSRYKKYFPILDVLRVHDNILDKDTLKDIANKLNHTLNGLYNKRHR